MATINKVTLILELIFIVLPISLILLVIGVPIVISMIVNYLNPENMTVAVITIIAVSANLCLWWLMIKYVRGYNVISRDCHWAWLIVSAGIGVVVIAYLLRYFPQPEPYTKDWFFYDQLETFVMGAPLILPAMHVYLVSKYWKDTKNV